LRLGGTLQLEGGTLKTYKVEVPSEIAEAAVHQEKLKNPHNSVVQNKVEEVPLAQNY